MTRIRRIAGGEARASLDHLIALSRRSKGSWGYDDAFMERFTNGMRTFLTTFFASMPDDPEECGGRVVLVACDGDDPPHGFAVVDLDRVGAPPAAAWLEDLWVEPTRFGDGAGRALWDAAIERVAADGRDALEFESDPNAEGFYLRMGADRVGMHPSDIEEGRMLPLMRAPASSVSSVAPHDGPRPSKKVGGTLEA